MMFKLRPVSLAGMVRRVFLLAGIFMVGVLPAGAGETISVPLDTTEVLKLDRDASVVLIANPAIADVVVESERLIFLFGLQPGETNLRILDSEGEEILTSQIVVVPLVERQITINRANLDEESTYSCASRCVKVATPVGTGKGGKGSKAGKSGKASKSGKAASGVASATQAVAAPASSSSSTASGGKSSTTTVTSGPGS